MKALIIDDEPLVRRSIKRALQASGHEVFEAVDGLEGLEEWRRIVPDLVFLDVLMPGMTGPELLKIMGSAKGPTKVVLISAYSGEYNLETVQKMGADLFIAKPFEDIFSVVKMAEELIKK